MAESRTQLLEYIADEIKNLKGIYVPIKASPLEVAMVRKISPFKLHPNPDDEFCNPKIGPNYQIISGYEQKIRSSLPSDIPPFDEPLIVQKITPGGYMLLNGHHRWAAARSCDMDPVPIKIVNLTSESDVQQMLSESDRTKRVTFDLDEVVFSSEEGYYEIIPQSLLGKKVKEQIRLGIPALFRFFNSKGYDVWVFSSEYYSIDHIRTLFSRYSVRVDGIVTGTGKKTAGAAAEKKSIEQLFAQKYKETINVDSESVVRIIKDEKDFDHSEISERGQGWSGAVMDIVSAYES